MFLKLRQDALKLKSARAVHNNFARIVGTFSYI